MKTALVLGSSGSFGGAMTQALVQAGWHVRALVRNPDKLKTQLPGCQVVAGDASNRADVERAAAGVDVIVYGVHPGGYRWHGVAYEMLDISASVTERNNQCLVFPANVYVYDPTQVHEFDETATQSAVTWLGQVRIRMEQRLKLASNNGAQVILFRMGDYISATGASSWIQQLVKPGANGYQLLAAGDRHLKHTWAYLPDAAKSIVKILEQRNKLAAFNPFHFRGYRITFNELAAAIEQASGLPVTIKNFPWYLLKILSPFSFLFRQLLKMRYLWQHELNLAQGRLSQFLDGQVLGTPLSQALIEAGIVRHRGKSAQKNTFTQVHQD